MGPGMVGGAIPRNSASSSDLTSRKINISSERAAPASTPTSHCLETPIRAATWDWVKPNSRRLARSNKPSSLVVLIAVVAVAMRLLYQMSPHYDNTKRLTLAWVC